MWHIVRSICVSMVDVEAVEDNFLPPPSTAQAMLQAPATLPAPPAQLSKVGRKRAPTAKALEAKKPVKRGGGRSRA